MPMAAMRAPTFQGALQTDGRPPDLFRIMLDPAIGRIDLRQFLLHGCLRLAMQGKRNRARAGGALAMARMKRGFAMILPIFFVSE
jgi:hypothetical protein